MSLGKDYLSLIGMMWEIEEFDMWYPIEHGTLAYLLDRIYETPEYPEKYNQIVSLAKEKNANELAWYISQETVEAARHDNNMTEEDLRHLEAMLTFQKTDYEEKSMDGYGIIDEKHMPDWFFELFGPYIKFEELKKKNSVINHCVSSGKMTREQAEEFFERIYKQYDLLNELYFFIMHGKLKTFYPQTVEKISAQMLCDKMGKTPLEAYEFLVYLREDPEKALAEYRAKTNDEN